ncbi:MAG: c-type cytochrome [Burkholderiales bacterium]|nr:MAG: c-type cytochrome [Burkholderiales bacterium]
MVAISNQERSLSGCANGPTGSSAAIDCISRAPRPELLTPLRVPSRMWRAIVFFGAGLAAACSAPVAPPMQMSGEAIAFGASAGGPRDACFSCHGLKGEGDAAIPRLAGLSTGYLVKQLEDFAGRWRDEPTMSPIAGRLSDADRLAVADYYATLNVSTDRPSGSVTGEQTLFHDGDPARNIKSCSTCHGADGRGGGLAQPRLAGQTSAYVRAQLTAWKESRRRNDPRDVMGQIARKLTDSEIESLAAHVASLP